MRLVSARYVGDPGDGGPLAAPCPGVDREGAGALSQAIQAGHSVACAQGLTGPTCPMSVTLGDVFALASDLEHATVDAPAPGWEVVAEPYVLVTMPLRGPQWTLRGGDLHAHATTADLLDPAGRWRRADVRSRPGCECGNLSPEWARGERCPRCGARVAWPRSLSSPKLSAPFSLDTLARTAADSIAALCAAVDDAARDMRPGAVDELDARARDARADLVRLADALGARGYAMAEADVRAYALRASRHVARPAWAISVVAIAAGVGS